MTPRMFYTLARVLAALTVIPFHEAGHALAAWLLGDPTAKQQGRLSLNPFRHFDLLGTLCMVFAGVGWAKPVSTDPRNFKNPKQGMALTALAGPVANLILAYLAMVVWKLISLNGSHIGNKYLVIKDDESIHFDKYKHISQNLNEASVAIDLGGLYDENTVVPTTVSTIWYDNKISKEIFSDLRKIMKRHASTTINGYMILKNAYSKKEQLRFATIGVQSPREYNLIV